MPSDMPKSIFPYWNDLPAPAYPSSLPVFAWKDECFWGLLASNWVVPPFVDKKTNCPKVRDRVGRYLL